MKKQKRKNAPARKSSGAAKPTAAAPVKERRNFLKLARNGGIAALILGGGGWYVVRDVQASIHEHDLSRIGQGVPTVVQVHDPNCPICRSLQRETRAALRAFDEGEIEYVIADITRPEGRQFAAAHGVSHVTLVLLDGAGRRQRVLQGQNQSDVLERAFAQHIRR